MIVKEERIGGQRLILGDCLEVMPLLGRVDAVVDSPDAVVFNGPYEKPTKWQHRAPARSDESLGTAPGGDFGLVCERGQVTRRDGEALQRLAWGVSEGAFAAGATGEVTRQGGVGEWAFQGRDAKHGLSEDDREGELQQVRGDTLACDPPSGRGSYKQHVEQSGSALLALPFKASQARMVEFPKGWAIITDPPYGIGRDGKKRCTRHAGYEAKGWDASRPEVALRVIAEFDCPKIIWGGNYFSDILPKGEKWLVWDKNQRIDQSDCELAWTSLPGALRVFNLGRHVLNADGAMHPTQKPVALMQWCLGFLPDAKIILDPFMGSGTTLVACQRMGRMGTGIELDPEYFDIACRRVDEAARQPDLLIAQPQVAAVQDKFDL